MKKQRILILAILVNPLVASAWQQRADHRICVELETHTRTLRGKLHLVYHNLSPDTLRTLYFHLYQNAFKPGSHLDRLRRARGDFSIAHLPRADWGWTRVTCIRTASGDTLVHHTDDTILEVPLRSALPPQAKLQLWLDFVTHIGRASYRMKENHGQYVVTQWYPKICVYDSHGGWHLDQHLGHEFYGEFGTFDVEITLPAVYIVGATGVLVNRAEVLPESLMAALDIHKFTTGERRPGRAINQAQDTSAATKTWIFHAENVHDFAWTADPTFRIGVAHWQHVTVYALARERKAARWQDAADVGAEVIAFYSKHIGRYPYPTMTIADVDEGMEYPMIVMCGGESPSYRYLFYHEIGHNWFYGVLANNETRNPHMDEGFTQLLHTMAMDSLISDPGNRDAYRWKNWYARRFFPRQNDRLYRQFLYLQHAKIGYEQKVDTHSDRTLDRLMYRLVAYNKPTTVLYALQYTLGRNVFGRVLQAYFHQWKFKHPYPEDFRQVVQKVSGWDLGWFFDEWWERTWTCDYAVVSVKNKRLRAGIWSVSIRLKRKGLAVMPLDLLLTLENGQQRRVLVPINRFHKTGADMVVNTPWDGWYKLNPIREIHLLMPSRVQRVEIDPTLRLPDVNRLDNVWPRHPVPYRVRMDNLFVTAADLDKYDLWLRPSVSYNAVDGLRIGFHADGSYLESPFSADKKLLTGIHFGTRRRTFQYSLHFRTPWRTFGRLANFVFTTQRLAGRSWHSLGLNATYRQLLEFPPWTQIRLVFRRSDLFDGRYLAVPWQDGPETCLDFALAHGWQVHTTKQTARFSLTTALVGSTDKYTVGSAEWVVSLPVHKRANLGIRFFGGLADKGTPIQERFFLAGANPVQEYQQLLYRARGTLPLSWRRKGHLHLDGGPNLRGYSGNNQIGTKALAANLTLRFFGTVERALRSVPLLKRLLRPAGTYLFADIGDVWTGRKPGALEADAGFGVKTQLAIVPPRLGRYVLDVAVPAYVRHPSTGSTKIRWRWVLTLAVAPFVH